MPQAEGPAAIDFQPPCLLLLGDEDPAQNRNTKAEVHEGASRREMDAAALEGKVLAVVKVSEARGDPPPVWVSAVERCVRESGLQLPCLELGNALVETLCFANNTPSLWKFLDQAIISGLLSPLHILSLLTSRIIPHRQSQPEAYRLYLELIRQRGISFSPKEFSTRGKKIAESVIHALQFPYCHEIPDADVGMSLAFFFCSVITNLVDCTMEDLGIELTYLKKNISCNVPVANDDLCANGKGSHKNHEFRQQLCKMNISMAMEVAEKLIADKKAKILFHLLHDNMPGMFNYLLQRFQFITALELKSPKLLSIRDTLLKLSENITKVVDGKHQLNKSQSAIGLADLPSYSQRFCPNSMTSLSTCWVPFDIFMEYTMDGKHLYTTSAIDILTDLITTLQVINQASWQETFQALWISALRLVQRELDSAEGPVPHLDSRLCILLSVTPLAIVGVIKKEIGSLSPVKMEATMEAESGLNQVPSVKHGLVSSVQLLRQFSGLLSPPPSVVTAANSAAQKAASFVSSFKRSAKVIDHWEASVEAVGSMVHLIVEACIARKLIDTSAYFWPGYVAMPSTLPNNPTPIPSSPWSKFMEGSQLTSPLSNALSATPASTVAEVKKLYNIALNGSADERTAATRILCAASLSRGWNIQEHILNVVIKLLSSPIPSDISGSHFSGYISTISPLLFGLCRIDVVYMISVYGMVPDVAAALMPLCEVFGSLPAMSTHRSSSSDETSIYSIFSCAFLFLLRLWKFYRPPQEHCVARRWGTVRNEVTLDYLLLLFNSKSNPMDIDSEVADLSDRSPLKPVYISSFPKLRAWYLQNQACIAATVSGFSARTSVHQVVNKILNMICRKMTPAGSSGGSLSGSSAMSSDDDAYQRPSFTAWEIMESLPFILEALLSACAHGKLSSRELITGLKDLMDFLPASLATIISYFSAEITRGVWKPVEMDGVDWPSPHANLLSIEKEIRDILLSAGVHIPSRHGGGKTAVILPLPMAALISLTITFKLEPSLEYISGVAGSALESCAANCSSPCMPIIGALWAQKVRRWHDFIVMSCARFPFEHDRMAIRQLLRSCFTSFMGSNLSSRGGVDGLLGHAVFPQGPARRVSPGLLYLRSCRKFYDPYFIAREIVSLVLQSVQETSQNRKCPFSRRADEELSSTPMLGASLLCISGGAPLVRVLYQETVPTWLLSASREVKGLSCHVLEGQALAKMIFLSGSFVWGVGESSRLWGPSATFRKQAISSHAEFVAGEMEGSFSLGCHPAMWKAYVLCWLRLILQFTPEWVPFVKAETLRKLANGLTAWHEGDLALSLLERGGPGAIEFLLLDS